MPRATQPHACLPTTTSGGASPPLEEYVPSTQTIEEEPPFVQVTVQDRMEAPAKRSRKGGRATQEKSTTKTKKTPIGRFHWDLRTQVILLECKRQYDEKRSSSDLYQKIKIDEDQWVDIVALCALRTLVVDWQQAYEKFKRLNISFQEINDWEMNIPPGKDSYWAMSSAERVLEGKITHCNFPLELYEVMDRLFGFDKAINPTATLMDKSNGLPSQASNGSPRIVNPTSDAGSFDRTPTNVKVEKKSRKRTHSLDAGLADATKDLMKGWELAEEVEKNAMNGLWKCNNPSMKA
ncbi:hypothetical protein L7F22_004271 [Adiantum nelumboides]|nr:hypothetical protein [Adiantum nelumboides]MCO5550780.1 hypothetical protein [Adiantum nelumboides]